jgi:hypothetical protein
VLVKACYPCFEPAPYRGAAVVNQTLASPSFGPAGFHPQAFGPEGRRAPFAVMTYERQALVIIVILTTMVRGTSTVFNGSAVVVVFAILHLPHTGGAITMLALIVIR